MTRHYLTNKQKLSIQKEIAKRRRSLQSVRLDAIALWARSEHNLSFTPSKPVLSRLCSASSSLVIPENNSKKNPRPAQPAIEEKLIVWINDQYIALRCLTGQMVRDKGNRLLAEVNGLLPEHERWTLKSTTGCLCNFQRRWNLKSSKIYGEAGDADEEGLQRELPVPRALCAQYGREDIFNADEAGVNYCMPPDRTISSQPLLGRKKDKKRLTSLVCANAKGTEKIPLMIIGHAVRPKCFEKEYCAKLGFDYSSNKKAWMTMKLFFDWLLRFDAYVRQTPGRKFLLLLDNFSGHGTAGCLPPFSAVQVKYLPPNTTSKLQPMDAGIIACLKPRYRSVQYNRALGCLEDGAENICKIDQLTAMKYLCSVWDNLPVSIIENCFVASGLIEFTGNDEESNRNLNTAVKGENEALENVMERVARVHTRMSIPNILNADDSDILEEIQEDDMAEMIVQDIMGALASPERDEDDEPPLLQLSESESIKAIGVVMQLNEGQPETNLRLQQELRALLRLQSRQSTNQMRETNIDSFFKK
ncbi:Tigger transposable element-derived protein 6 [Gracilariopsis chorda]|uniref:Tigger transposable element-derived protein 6 n=1 Tax=Gracilariopsis chorda TaxID=448386 RepID=A0A2V3J1Q7_9FLOR|nr:Tigger transposable element-derived protein 6 [Gracilariopsis chorda]|eukprot:PXF48371.1 Tigger transposable element-derived protein 6 [Gracilariopsis chorda]